MSIIIFTGPTLSPQACAELIDANHEKLMVSIRPPAKQGDVYRATLEQPKAIAIIDGYFQNVPALWHKEILYAMSQGIHVFGCSSMGALRAAELALHGMQGIGTIYQQFANGQLEDDDEVAVVHAPKELDYQSLSDAMVNIRATLNSACDAGIINPQQRCTLTTSAKNLHYAKRSYSHLLELAQPRLTPAEHQALTEFCTNQSINVKRNDALALIEHLASIIDNLPAKTVDYGFAHTDAWQALIDHVNQQAFDAQNDVDMQALTHALKSQGRFEQLKIQAQARQIALDRAKQHQNVATQQQVQSALLTLARQQQCIKNNQIDFNKLSQWFNEQQLSQAKFHQLIQKQALLGWVDTLYENIDEPLLDILRLNNELAQYLDQIKIKQA